MATNCITKETAEKLKQAAKEGKINIEDMYRMTSAGRRALFADYVDGETAAFVNGKFEGAMVSADQTALVKWAKETFNVAGQKKTAYNDIIKKINDLKDIGVLDPQNEPAFLEDLAATKLGVTISADEAKTISEKAGKLQELNAGRSEFGTPTLEYFQAHKDMMDYLASVSPTSRTKVATSIIARGSLLLSVKSPLVNVISNTAQAITRTLARRLENRAIGGMNNEYAKNYMKFTNDVYAKTGYDVSRMLTLESEKVVRGEDITHSQGPGKVRALGRFYEDLVFKKMQGAPDVAFSAFAFADRANIESTKIVNKMGLKGDAAKQKALEIFKDATSIEPTTEEGQAVRANGIADAMYSTYTNKSGYSDFALGIRRLFNIASGDLRVGDNIMPFVKTPANVIGAGIDASGVLIPAEVVIRAAKAAKAIHDGASPKEAFGDSFTGFGNKLITAGIGLSFAYLLSQLFQPDDYIGEYPTTEKERQLLLLKNAAPNSLKIGGKWVSLDYFGPLGAPLTGMMHARKYGTTLPETAWEYTKGVGRQTVKIPGFDDFYNLIDSLKKAAPGSKKSLDKEIKDLGNFAISFVRARTIPALVSDIAKGTDSVERIAPAKDALSQLKAGVPFLGIRQKLPEKKTVLGDTVQSEGILSTLLFGTRVKTSQDSALIGELDRLATVGQLPSVTDVEKTSPRAQDLLAQIGEEKFAAAKEAFGKRLKDRFTRIIGSSQYKALNDEKKSNLLQKYKDIEFESMLRRAGYKKPKK